MPCTPECLANGGTVNHRDCPPSKARAAFWERLERDAPAEVELLEGRAPSDPCERRASVSEVFGRPRWLTRWQRFNLAGHEAEIREGGDPAEHVVGLLGAVQGRIAQRQLLQLQFCKRCHSPLGEHTAAVSASLRRATLTFREGMETHATLQVEALQASELPGAYSQHERGSAFRRKVRRRRARLAFREGLESQAVLQIELRQAAELPRTCATDASAGQQHSGGESGAAAQASLSGRDCRLKQPARFSLSRLQKCPVAARRSQTQRDPRAAFTARRGEGGAPSGNVCTFESVSPSAVRRGKLLEIAPTAALASRLSQRSMVNLVSGSVHTPATPHVRPNSPPLK